jgi:hypothetical protein
MVSRLYLEIVQALDARRRRLGWTCEQLDDAAGAQDRYWAKALHPDTPSGRQAGWDMLQLYADALFPAGVNLLALAARHVSHRHPRRVPPPPPPAQSGLDLGGGVMLRPARRVEDKPQLLPDLPRPANQNSQLGFLDALSVDTSPGKHFAAVADARRSGPARVYRRGGLRAV